MLMAQQKDPLSTPLSPLPSPTIHRETEGQRRVQDDPEVHSKS